MRPGFGHSPCHARDELVADQALVGQKFVDESGVLDDRQMRANNPRNAGLTTLSRGASST